MSIEEFRLSLPKCSLSILKQLLEGIYEFKRSQYKKFKTTEDNPVVLDIERKESIIMKELERRGIDIAGQEFVLWLRKMMNRADKIYISLGKN